MGVLKIGIFLLRADLLWCGIRDSAPFASAISAIHPNLDTCCRAHDNCGVVVDRGTCKLGVCNPSSVFPVLDCRCEEKFMKCLMVRLNAAEENTLSLHILRTFRKSISGRSTSIRCRSTSNS